MGHHRVVVYASLSKDLASRNAVASLVLIFVASYSSSAVDAVDAVAAAVVDVAVVVD